MIVRIKPGAKVRGLSPEMAVAFVVIVEAYRGEGAPECTITSGVDGTHSAGSKHYVGNALDIRCKGISAMQTIRDKIAEALGGDFDVVLERDHLHVEFDPKEPLDVVV